VAPLRRLQLEPHRRASGDHRAARAALVALDEPEPPPFDSETDEFAIKRADADMAAALREPHHHQTDWVFKKIVERELRSPDIVRAGGDTLRDVYRFSEGTTLGLVGFVHEAPKPTAKRKKKR